MDAHWAILFSCLWILTISQDISSFLDIDELKEVNYGVDILKEPVVMRTDSSEAEPGNSIYLTSKYGQRYQCSFPDHVQQEKEKEEAEKVAMETGIPDLLKPMESGPCLVKVKDWWSYEFCYGKHIRQFHVEEGQILGNIMYLGVYESEFDWANSTNKESHLKMSNKIAKYHTQQYVNGTKCDLTGKPRRTEVRFICEEGSGDRIARLDEPETCVYVMTIHTTKICHHPYLKPPTPTKTVMITCNPLLSVQQYQDYLDAVEAAEARRQLEKEKEKMKEKLKEASGEGSDNGFTPADHGVEMDTETDVTGQAGSKLDTETSEDLSEDASGADVDVKMVVKVIKDPADMQNFIDEAMKEIRGMKTLESGESDEDKTAEGEKEEVIKTDGENIDKDKKTDEEEEEEDYMDEFDSELKEIRARYKQRRDKLMAMKEKVRGSMEQQFDEILEEAKEELGEEGLGETEIDKKQAFQQLATTLNKLIEKLESTEKEIGEVDKELEDFTSKNGISTKTDTGPTNTDTAADSTRETAQSELKATGPDKMSLKDGDNRVKVRVTKIKSGDTIKEGSELTDKHTAALEKTVKEGLEEAGIDGTNGKIHVKIITAGYYDDKDDSVHVLSDEESESFRNMIVSIIGGTGEAKKEEERQNKLEENYGFVWGKEAGMEADQGVQHMEQNEPPQEEGAA